MSALRVLDMHQCPPEKSIHRNEDSSRGGGRGARVQFRAGLRLASTTCQVKTKCQQSVTWYCIVQPWHSHARPHLFRLGESYLSGCRRHLLILPPLTNGPYHDPNLPYPQGRVGRYICFTNQFSGTLSFIFFA